MIISPKYIPYKKRFRRNLINIIILTAVYLALAILLICELNIVYIFFLLSAYILSFASIFKTDIVYLKSVKIDKFFIEIIIVDKDKEREPLNLQIENTKIEISENSLLLYNSLGRNYKLEIQENIQGRPQIFIEQEGCHEWNYNTFKEICSKVSAQKKKIENGIIG